jgi:hypothetical protein
VLPPLADSLPLVELLNHKIHGFDDFDKMPVILVKIIRWIIHVVRKFFLISSVLSFFKLALIARGFSKVILLFG